MIRITGDNIISALGFTTEENFCAVKRGVSGVKHYDAGTFGLPEAFMASLVDREKLNAEFSKISPEISPPGEAEGDYTPLEKAAILSVYLANNSANNPDGRSAVRTRRVDMSDKRLLFILSTTKGNVELLERSMPTIDRRLHLWHSAKVIARFFGNSNPPVVVSNACISGAAAQIAAMRELESGEYDRAVVVGADLLSKFIVSGFQSFKALSPQLCRPFDRQREGLNLGEAAATIIFERDSGGVGGAVLAGGAIRNDANHISAPSRTGEGCYRALKNVLQEIDIDDIAFINAHGTATPYNDAMEAVAIVRAGLEKLPVNSLKPFFGHTLGAAGVLETIISVRALEEKLVLRSLNFSDQEFESPINVSQKNCFSDKPCFIKMLSGFGGCNAALAYRRGTI